MYSLTAAMLKSEYEPKHFTAFGVLQKNRR